MIHHTEFAEIDGVFRSICSCGASSGPRFSKAEAQEWEDQHQILVGRARAHLRSRTPSLKDQYTYYRERAADPHETAENRLLWKMLADGLAARVAAPEKDDPLDVEIKYTPRRHRGRTPTDRP